MPEESELFAYIRRHDAKYDWHIANVTQHAKITIVELNLTSQVWQGIPWTHQIRLFLPAKPRHRDFVTLYISTPPGNGHADHGILVAEATGAPCAFLSDIPNQPLFDDLIEDALIAYTFAAFLDTGDATWPLLLPMTKSVVRAMDAIQVFAQEHGAFTAKHFLVSGASKRGWTTWLTAAVDERVAAIAPMVYDNLNLAAQMPHQLEVMESYSDQIGDYTALNLPQRMQTPEGQRLATIVDPYTYRERLTQTKLIINGSNDPYWATDAINLYWDALSGPKYLLDIPGVGHSLNDPQRLYSTYIAFVRSVIEAQPLPEMEWTFTPDKSAIHFAIRSKAPANAARCWIACASGRDFRAASWNSVDLAATDTPEAEGTIFHAAIARPDSGHIAIYGEVDFTRNDLPFSLTTQVHVASASNRLA